MSPANISAARLPENESVADLLNDIDSLVSPPDVCLRIFELIHAPRTSSKEIASVVSLDPSLTARLLRMANSAYYSFSRKIDTVSRAVTIIGNSELYSLVLSVSAVKSFTCIPNELVSMETFWRHSVYTGLLARALARRVNMMHPERLFVAGLLHDIGSVVLYHERAEEMRDLLLIADGDEDLLYQAELDQLGFTHATLGGHLLGKWQTPDELQQAVLWHHEPAKAECAVLEAHLVHLASQLANGSEQGNFAGLPAPEVQIPAGILDTVRLNEEALASAVREADDQFPSTLGALL